MKYEKLTPDGFKQKLKDGSYAGIGGARRAIGKFQGWKEKERDWARQEAEKFFGASGGAPAKKASKKAAKKPAAAASAKKPGRKPKVKRQIHPKNAAKMAAKAAKTSKPVSETPEVQQAAPAPKTKPVKAAKQSRRTSSTPDSRNIIAEVRAEVELTTTALAGLQAAKNLATTLIDVDDSAKICAAMLQASVSKLQREILSNNKNNGMPASAQVETPPPPAPPVYHNPEPQAAPPPPPTGNFAATVVVPPPTVLPVSSES